MINLLVDHIFLSFPYTTVFFCGILNPDHMQLNMVDLGDMINWVYRYCFNLKKLLSIPLT